jgi:hypothetical protein
LTCFPELSPYVLCRLGRAIFVFFVGDSASAQPIADTPFLNPFLSLEALTVRYSFDLQRQPALSLHAAHAFAADCHCVVLP